MEQTFKHTAFMAAASLLFSGGLIAFAQQQPGGMPQQQQPTQPRQEPGMGQPGSPGYNPGAVNETPPMQQKVNDQKFLKKAAEGGMAEIAMGKLAEQKGSTEAVKQFGQKLVNDHTKANDQLKEVAAKENLEVPSALSKKHQKQVDKLAKLSGPKFDKAFIHHAVKDHKKDIEEFKAEAQHGSNPTVRQFASNSVPVLQEHLNIAENLQKSNGQSSMKGAHGMNGQNGGMQDQGSQ